MLAEILMLFIILTIIMFIISMVIVDEYPIISVPFIIVGMIFCILSAYGLWNIETQYVGYNATFGNTSFHTYSTASYGDPYSYVFFFFFFVFFLLFIRAGWRYLEESLKTKGELDLKTRYGNRRR